MDPKAPHEEFNIVQLLSLMLSIFILAGLAVEALVPLSPPATSLLDRIDFAICLFFLGEFIYRFSKAKSKLEFMKWGWIDLLSSIPAVGVWQLGRVARIFRILRVLRLFRSSADLWNRVSHNPPKATLKGAVLVAIASYILASVLILQIETAPDSNIKTPNDALWWSFMNMITVGCEKYPVTDWGRLIGAVMSIIGVGLTGIYTAYVASVFMSGLSAPTPNDEILREIKALRSQLRTRDES